jgi:lysophospholipase L1-like esterase/pimeloyl-ACP methyl ester carboxylesterase
MRRLYTLIFLILTGNGFLLSQNNTNWDNTQQRNWDKLFEIVSIPSSSDGKIQHAFFYKTSRKEPQPLIVSLHTWSGDYTQEDPLAKETLLRDWNYIHPDFRGPNNSPEACGSNLVISDILDAIEFAQTNSRVDSSNIHIIGVSGGAYTTLMAYMKLPYPVRSFNAWVPISDLYEWYWESKGRKLKYTEDLEGVVRLNGIMDWQDLKRRSPMTLPFPGDIRKNSELNIYAGIHDGYTGSVPIIHSIRFFNKIAKELNPEEQGAIIPDSTIISLLTKRMNPLATPGLTINDRFIHLQKKLPGLKLTIFEGGHEMLVESALSLTPNETLKILEPLNILTVGDSNGTNVSGWPTQLKKLLPYSKIINKSISGNTIGFDNLNQPELNTIKNIEKYLNDALGEIPLDEDIHFILLGIGTNDAKNIYKNRQKEVIDNLSILIRKIKDYFRINQKELPQLCILSPPPMDENKLDKLKYEGGDERIRKYMKEFKKIASANGIDFLNTYETLKLNFGNKTKDGVHLNEKAQFELAVLIINYLNLKSTI